MKMKRLVVILIVEILVYSCSNVRYSTNAEKTFEENYAEGESGLKVKIPEGWFRAFDTENNFFDVWLVNEDYSASLKFTVINIDSLNGTLVDVFEISQTANKITYGNPVSFENDKNESSDRLSYKIFKEGKVLAGVTVFKINDTFYECKADFADNFPENEKKSIFELQKSIIDDLSAGNFHGL